MISQKNLDTLLLFSMKQHGDFWREGPKGGGIGTNSAQKAGKRASRTLAAIGRENLAIHKMIEPDLRAKWIWLEASENRDVFLRARKKFTCNSLPSKAFLRITCSGNYRLWINGKFAGRGPAGSVPWKKRYDILDVATFLNTGENIFAVHLVHFGYRTAHCPESPAGFWCQLDGENCALESDASWLFSADLSFDREAGRRNWNYGLIEVYDARREENWLDADFDDSTWQPAVICPAGHGQDATRVSPWTNLMPRGIPQCREKKLLPQVIVRIAEVEEQEAVISMGGTLPNLAAWLLQDVPIDSKHVRIENAESLLSDGNSPAIVTQASPLDRNQPYQRHATIILDFGREITGYGWLDVDGNEGAIVDIAYGERLIAGRVQPVMQGVGYADRYILKEGRQHHEVYDWKGYRYVQLTFRNLTRPLLLHKIGTTFSSYPLESVGAFACSDANFNRIWEVGGYTQQLCTHDALTDCPWREQQQWLGDGRVQLVILQNVFGESAIARKFIEQFAEEQFSSGMIPAVSFNSSSYIVDYALLWIQAIKDVLLFDRDVALANSLIPNIIKLLNWFKAYQNESGLIENVPGWVFIDWADIGKDGVCAPLNAIYFMALKSAAEIANVTGHFAHEKEWNEHAEKIERSFHEIFWNERRGFYADNVGGGRGMEKFSRHTQAIAVLTSLAKAEHSTLMLRVMDDQNLVPTEPYFSFYLLEALGKCGLAGKALDFIRDQWGNMIREGATTFWEEWQPTNSFREGRWLLRPRSQCHAWSAAPSAWLSRYVLGVRVESLNGNIIIAPQLGWLTRAEGVVPTCYGPVKIQWEIRDGHLAVKAVIPDGVHVDFRESPGFKGKSRFEKTGLPLNRAGG